MNEAETIEILSGMLEAHKPFVHCRFGDGDVMFATGIGSKITADGEEWSPELQQRMIQAWFTLAKADVDLLLGDLESVDVSDGVESEWWVLLKAAEWLRGRRISLVHVEALRCSRKGAVYFYETLRNDDRRKVYVAPERLKPVADWLGAEHIPVPLHVAHEEVSKIMSRLVTTSPVPEVMLVSAGRGGKILQSYLAAAWPPMTQIDIGSGLDMLIDDGVRRGTDLKVNRAKVLAEYAKIGWLR